MTDAPKVIALFGPCCSGKSTFARATSAIGFEVVEVSEVVRLPSGRTVLEASWEELCAEIPETYTKFGRAYFADQLLDHLRAKHGSKRLLVSGIRVIEELAALELLSSVRAVGLFASYNVRVERLRKRKGSPADPAKYVFLRDLAEARWGLPLLFEQVGFDGTLFTDELDQSEVAAAAMSVAL